MKVPKPPSAPAPPEKDRTLTRRTVAGAAGGMKGVDYEDARREEGAARTEAPAREPPMGGAQAQGPGGPSARGAANQRAAEARAAETARLRTDHGEPLEPVVVYVPPDQVKLDEEELNPKGRQRRKQRAVLARDRLLVDKDAPERRRPRRWLGEEPEEEVDPLEEQVDVDFDLDLLAEAAPAPRAHLFASEEQPEPGDAAYTDPEAIQRAYPTPHAYAKHVMILTEAFRKATGATRQEAIEYMGRLFVAAPDRAFGRTALREFGPATGIVDVYPLEVVAHVLERYPGFLPKVGFGRLFSNAARERVNVFYTDPRTPVVLEYPEELKLRGFALAGGGRVGYEFAPDETPGRYRLWVRSTGRHTVLVSATNRSGHTTIDRFQVVVRARRLQDLELHREEASAYPARQPDKVAAWPVPPPPAFDPEELLEDELTASEFLSSADRVRLQEADRGSEPVRGPVSVARPPLPAFALGPLPEEDELSVEDQEVLLAAVVDAIDEPAAAGGPGPSLALSSEIEEVTHSQAAAYRVDDQEEEITSAAASALGDGAAPAAQEQRPAEDSSAAARALTPEQPAEEEDTSAAARTLAAEILGDLPPPDTAEEPDTSAAVSALGADIAPRAGLALADEEDILFIEELPAPPPPELVEEAALPLPGQKDRTERLTLPSSAELAGLVGDLRMDHTQPIPLAPLEAERTDGEGEPE